MSILLVSVEITWPLMLNTFNQSRSGKSKVTTATTRTGISSNRMPTKRMVARVTSTREQSKISRDNTITTTKSLIMVKKISIRTEIINTLSDRMKIKTNKVISSTTLKSSMDRITWTRASMASSLTMIKGMGTTSSKSITTRIVGRETTTTSKTKASTLMLRELMALISKILHLKHMVLKLTWQTFSQLRKVGSHDLYRETQCLHPLWCMETQWHSCPMAVLLTLPLVTLLHGTPSILLMKVNPLLSLAKQNIQISSNLPTSRQTSTMQITTTLTCFSLHTRPTKLKLPSTSSQTTNQNLSQRTKCKPLHLLTSSPRMNRHDYCSEGSSLRSYEKLPITLKFIVILIMDQFLGILK